jgi:glutathione S-transferase
MIKLYGHEISGNSYKVRLMLSLLNLEYQWIKVDLLQGKHKLDAYLAMNAFGQVPTLVDEEKTITDAQAILVYLAAHYGGDRWLPREPLNLSRVVRWLSVTAGELRQGLEDARLYHLFGAGTNINIDRANQKSTFILGQLEQHLATRHWLEMSKPTIADIAVFPYVTLSKDANISLDAYPALLAWIDRVKNLSGYVPMDRV